jgi:putative glycosyltransferase (TIGR04372 family)
MFYSFHHKLLYKIGNLLNIIILVPHPDSIGNAAEEIFFATLKAKREKKKLAIIFCKKIPLQSFFFKNINFYDKDYFCLNSKHFLFKHNSFFQKFWSLIFTLFFVTEKIIHSFATKIFSFKKSGYYWRPMSGQDIIWRPSIHSSKFDTESFKKQDWNSQFKDKLDIDIEKKVDLECRNVFKNLGFENKWFVCLHVRDRGYRGDFDNPFNSNMENYLLSIKEIINRGGLVFRLGDTSMIRLPKIDGLIDYPFTKYKSPKMDNYLIKNCKFYLGTTSGPMDSANFIYRKKLLLVNVSYYMVGLPFNENSLCIFRHAYSKSMKKYLSIKEMLLAYEELQLPFWISNDWDMKENNEIEILEAVKEMLNDKKDSNATNLQVNFRSHYFEACNYLVKHFNFNNNELENCNEWYRWAPRMFNWHGEVSKSFLENNWDINSRN